MRPLSKSKLLAYRQCPKRLWMEIHAPELKIESEQAQARFGQGHEVGEVARFLYDPNEDGSTVDPVITGWKYIFFETHELIGQKKTIFEASFQYGGAMCMVDVLLPKRSRHGTQWRMIEVKSSASVQDYHRDDIAFQAYLANANGMQLDSVAVAHVNLDWVYKHEGDYRGLLTEVDLTQETFAREAEVVQWIDAAKAVMRKRKVPDMTAGSQCKVPFECAFLAHCRSQQAQPEHPVHWLPRAQTTALKEHLAVLHSQEMRDVPDDLLNPIQLRVKQCTLKGKSYFDAEGAAGLLKQYKAHKLPLYFLDFEAVQFAVPRWIGTRPYQHIPFQFSCHYLSRNGKLSHTEFLDLSGSDPSKPLAQALIKACGSQGAILAYSADFERSRIRELAQSFPRLKTPLLAIAERIVDLLPVAQQHYYHPDMQGSWSIKKVLPCLVPSLSYEELDGVQNGGSAVTAYVKATALLVEEEEVEAIDTQLRRYCQLDTYAMVRLWQVFAGRHDLEI